MNYPSEALRQIAETIETTKNRFPAEGFVLAMGKVHDERIRQHEKWNEQFHEMPIWLAILNEEVGELSEAVLHKEFGGPEAENVLKEAVQVAAVAVQIVEFLIKKGAA